MSHATTSPYQPSTYKPMTAEEKQQKIASIRAHLKKAEVSGKRLDASLTKQEREVGIRR